MKRSYPKKVTETESLSQDDTDVDSKLEMMGMKLKKSKKEIVTESPTSLALVPMVSMKAQLICTTCTKKFTYKKNFVRHQAVHSHTRPFHCEFCWRRFPTDFGRKQHTRVHLADTKIKTENNSSSSSRRRRSSSNSSSNVDTANNNNSSSSTIRKKVVSLPVVNQDLKQGRVGRCVTGEEDYCKCQICGKIFARWWFLNNHIASMHTPCAMRGMANRNKRANHEDGVRLPTIVKTEAGKDEDNCAIKSDAQTEITKNMNTRKKARTKYVCNICQHKFQLYAQMCKHKRDCHNKTLLELEDVPENAALNLHSFIDGTSDSLSHFTKYVKIRDYTSMYDYDSDYTQPTSIEWSEYNFPSSFHIPVEESKCSGVSCMSDTPSTRAEFDNDEEVSSKDKSNNQSEKSLKPFSVKSHGDENSSEMRVEEFSDYMKKNPIIQWEENSSDTNVDLTNDELCLAGYASCDSASKFRESVDKTNNDLCLANYASCDSASKFRESVDKTNNDLCLADYASCDSASKFRESVDKTNNDLCLANYASCDSTSKFRESVDKTNNDLCLADYASCDSASKFRESVDKTNNDLCLANYASCDSTSKFRESVDKTNNDLCLANYASCDSASKFRESVDKTNNDLCLANYASCDPASKFRESVDKTNNDLCLANYASCDSASKFRESVDKTNNDLCLANYASCDSTSKFRESVDTINNDSHKVSSDVQNGLVPRKNLKDFERSVPSFSFWEKHNLSLDCSQVQHERHTITDYICSVCQKHFRTLDLCLRHQQERHPHIDCHLLEGEHGNGSAARHYPIPSRIGLLAHSTIDLAVRTNLKCTKCTNFFASVTQLHHHIADCATEPDVATGITANRLGKKPF